jgi:hypothetical protein
MSKFPSLEELSENVVDLPAERRPRFLELLEQALVHLTLARIRGDEVPEVAYLGLSDTMNAPEALLDFVGVPREIVVDHQVGAPLEVHPLASGIVRDQESDRRVRVEGAMAARLASRASPPYRNNRTRLARSRADLRNEVVESVLGLGEDHDLAPEARRRIAHDRVVEGWRPAHATSRPLR